MISIYNIIELKSWEKIKEKFDFDDEMKLSNNEEKELENYLINEFKNNNYIITIRDLANAVRRLISRYLDGTNYKNSNKLYEYIIRSDLWDEQDDILEDNLEKIFEGIKDNINICENFGGELRLGHSLIFYQILDKICERKQDEDKE